MRYKYLEYRVENGLKLGEMATVRYESNITSGNYYLAELLTQAEYID